MNPHAGQGPPGPASQAIPHQSRRHQEYHQYQQQQQQQQHAMQYPPAPQNPYAYQYPQQYYGHQPQHMPYQMPRWMPQQGYPSYQMQMPMHNGQRSPMYATPPQVPQSQYSRPSPYAHIPMQPPSPYTNPATQSPALSHPISSPREAPSHSSTPQPPSRRPSSVAPLPQPAKKAPFSAPLPWYSPPEAEHDFPPRARRRKRRRHLVEVADSVFIPDRNYGTAATEEDADLAQNSSSQEKEQELALAGASEEERAQPIPATSDVGNKLVNGQSSADQDSSTPAASTQSTDQDGDPPVQVHRTTTGAVHKLAAPIIPALPQIAVPRAKSSQSAPNGDSVNDSIPISTAADGQQVAEASAAGDGTAEVVTAVDQEPVKTAPKSWADLVRSKAAAAQGSSANGVATSNGHADRSGTIGEVLSTFDVQQERKIAFTEPRGLVNTGNMCYMNSILQVLVSCIPFYNFLDQVGKRAAHSFKSDTPLVDAMIMFMREFNVIDSAESVEKLRMRLKENELEQYGDPLIPEYVYGVINRLPRFSSMRRGHQQDAEEFLGFLLAGMHDECVAVMRSQGGLSEPSEMPTSPASSVSQATDGWLEVGPKQRAAITRQAGDPTASSPVTRIFGGALRSEFRVPGLKNSVTLEPYQPLQLDIGAPNINNITDALKGLTKPESLSGDFHSPRGPGTSATKQIFIETLPPILILHLKRFQYDSSGGTQKIWKRIGYPLEFEMPKEVFSPAKRGGMAMKGGMPRYRLNAVVYHHGKSAAGGHYTVDLLRQDKREWVRIDDTFIRRVRSEDVAEGGAEEDPKVLAKALERHQAEAESSAKRNPYEELDGNDDEGGSGGRAWSDVNGDNKKRWAGVAANTGTATPTSTLGKSTPRREGVKDNKVAYILLYEKIAP